MEEKTAVEAIGTLVFKGHVEDGVLIPEEGVALPDGTYWVSLQSEPQPIVDAFDELLSLAQPLGPPDLARNFDSYTGRLISDDLTS